MHRSAGYYIQEKGSLVIADDHFRGQIPLTYRTGRYLISEHPINYNLWNWFGFRWDRMWQQTLFAGLVLPPCWANVFVRELAFKQCWFDVVPPASALQWLQCADSKLTNYYLHICDFKVITYLAQKETQQLIKTSFDWFYSEPFCQIYIMLIYNATTYIFILTSNLMIRNALEIPRRYTKYGICTETNVTYLDPVNGSIRASGKLVYTYIKPHNAKYFRINHGDQRVVFILKVSVMS